MRFLLPHVRSLAHAVTDAVFPPRDTELLARACTEEALLQHLRPALVVGSGGAAPPVMGLCAYADAYVQACIVEAKFGGNKRAARLLGVLLAEFLYEFLSESAAFSHLPPVLVPVPLSRERERERGFNQVTRVLEAAAARLSLLAPSIPLYIDTGLLRRTRETAPQTSLSGAERRKNLTGAFETTASLDPARTYIVVDDVVTTGSTLHATCDALAAGGATRLLPLAFAR